MSEKVIMSFQATVEEKETIKLAAAKEVRTVSNYILVAVLERAKEKHGLIPDPEEEG